MGELFCLYEFAPGYAVIRVKEWEQIGQDADAVQAAVADYGRFSGVCSLKAFHGFANAEEALENMNAVAVGRVTQDLTNFLELALPKKQKGYKLGVIDTTLAKGLSEAGFPVCFDKNVAELLRGVRQHFSKFTKGLSEIDADKARCGLGHSFSRTKMKLDPNRQDKPIIQTIGLIDLMDKSINMFSMRIREWYCWHFPELGKIVSDNTVFAKCANLIGNREEFTESENQLERLEEAVGSSELAAEIAQAMRNTMGQDIAAHDVENIRRFSSLQIGLAKQRQDLLEYLQNKLSVVAPNLQTLVGEIVAARLLSQAGSLVTLAKFPSSTVQILGAEKALFRALKAKGNTPKYGLLFQSTFIGRAALKNKGRISRYLANKCSLCARLDHFADRPSNIYGDLMKNQVEERLKFLSDGVVPQKNLDVMREAALKHGAFVVTEEKTEKKLKKKEKKEIKNEMDDANDTVEMDVDTKKSKKKRVREEAVEEEEVVVKTKEKKKKKKHD
eukprot:GHVR01181003.1.p1 GENE.GHVR01181003.1~~GHVR01181003.1.p1  ORF type:complete len:501 (+),score=75.35 GHVR01181003.1:44-1546(+)